MPGHRRPDRELWCELGHLVMDHHEDGISESEADQRESAANAFAAELLLPAETLVAMFPDNTVLSNFAIINRIDLLSRLANGNGRWCATGGVARRCHGSAVGPCPAFGRCLLSQPLASSQLPRAVWLPSGLCPQPAGR